MKAEKTQDGVIINDCKNLGEHEGAFYKNENIKLHFDCNKSRYCVGGLCLFPFHITDPKCCAGYASGGEKKVAIPKIDLVNYYKKEFDSTIITARGEKPDILK